MSRHATVNELSTVELAASSGLDLGSGDWFTIEQTRVNAFADTTLDDQWIHVDPERAAKGPFETTVAHGYLSLSLVPYLLSRMLRVTDSVRGTNYGIERLRFTSVVPVGSRVRLRASIAEAVRRDDGGVRYAVAVPANGQGRRLAARTAVRSLVSAERW